MNTREPISSLAPDSTANSTVATVETTLTLSPTTSVPRFFTNGLPQMRTLEPSSDARRKYQRARSTAIPFAQK